MPSWPPDSEMGNVIEIWEHPEGICWMTVSRPDGSKETHMITEQSALTYRYKFPHAVRESVVLAAKFEATVVKPVASKSTAPSVLISLADTILPDWGSDEAIGDFMEGYSKRIERGSSKWRANIWFLVQVLWTVWHCWKQPRVPGPKTEK